MCVCEQRTSVKYESFLIDCYFQMAWREALRQPIPKPTAPKPKFDTKDDDWDTDINYEVDIDRDYVINRCHVIFLHLEYFI
jgi:hypothetical protein